MLSNINFNLKTVVYAVVSFILLVFVFQFVSSPMVVTVTGIGELSVPAETGVITFSLTANKEDPKSSVDQLKSDIQKLKDTVKGLGVLEGDIFESQITVVPASALISGASGYQSAVSMGLKVNEVSNIESIIVALYRQGVAVVSQPQLTVGDINGLEQEAYELALKDAKSKAFNIALKHLKPITKIVLIQETQSQSSTTVKQNADEATQAEKDISPDTGLIKVSKVLSVSYKMW